MITRRKSIKIAGVNFKIVQKKRVDLDGDWGEADIDKREIYIARETTDEEFNATLKHEILHCLLRMSGLFYSILKEDYEAEEGMVRMVENLYLPIIEQIDEKI